MRVGEGEEEEKEREELGGGLHCWGLGGVVVLGVGGKWFG